MAGSSGTHIILQSPETDIAVLETARRGNLTRGFGFDWRDVAAVLNVADDHIGTDGISNIEDLARIKGLVARAARKLLVLNGEDPRCVGMADEAEAEHIFYVTMATDPGSLIKAHIAAGGMAATLRPDDGGALIEFHDGGEVTRILLASDLPSAFGSKAMHNVQNAMFAVALGHGMGASIADILAGLLALKPNHQDMPGRLDFFTGFPFLVILDYAHNADKFNAVSAVVNQLEYSGRRIVAFTSPGNRTDPHLDNLAATAAQSTYDHYICFRRHDLRGRGPREVPECLRNGLIAAGIPTENTSVVPIEEDAANAALDMSQPSDIIALLYMDHDKIWELLRAPQ